MRNVKYLLLAGLCVSLLGLGGLLNAADEKPKFTIKEVMNQAHKMGLLKKVTKGDGNKEDKEKLLSLYTALAANKPGKGDEKEWKEKTTAIVDAAKEVVGDKEGAGKKLSAATKCQACHDIFK